MPQNYGSMESGGSSQGQDVTSLSNRVAQSIEIITKNTHALERFLNGTGMQQDTPEFRQEACDVQKATAEVIAKASGDLAQLNRASRGATKKQRLMADKLTQDFETALGKYAMAQAVLSKKMQRTLMIANISLQRNQPADNSDTQLMQQEQLQYQLQLDDARDRENQIREIENFAVDVNEIMLTLSTQIQQQGQHIATIESNIENVHGNVEQGASELSRAATYQNKYRKKVLILLLIAIIVGVIVTSIVVADVKN